MGACMVQRTNLSPFRRGSRLVPPQDEPELTNRLPHSSRKKNPSRQRKNTDGSESPQVMKQYGRSNSVKRDRQHPLSKAQSGTKNRIRSLSPLKPTERQETSKPEQTSPLRQFRENEDSESPQCVKNRGRSSSVKRDHKPPLSKVQIVPKSRVRSLSPLKPTERQETSKSEQISQKGRRLIKTSLKGKRLGIETKGGTKKLSGDKRKPPRPVTLEGTNVRSTSPLKQKEQNIHPPESTERRKETPTRKSQEDPHLDMLVVSGQTFSVFGYFSSSVKFPQSHVYEASINGKGKKEFAIKMVPIQASNAENDSLITPPNEEDWDEFAVERQLLNEISALKSINHDNVLSLTSSDFVERYNDLETTSQPLRCCCIVTPLLSTDLESYIIHNGPILDEIIASRLFVGLCSGVAAIHKNNFRHNDIIPKNVLLQLSPSGDGTIIKPVIADLGAVTPLVMDIKTRWEAARVRRFHERYTNPAYRAPELWKMGRIAKSAANSGCKLPTIADKADAFAVGCTLYYTLFGMHAFGKLDKSNDQPPDKWVATIARKSYAKAPRFLLHVCFGMVEELPAWRLSVTDMLHKVLPENKLEEKIATNIWKTYGGAPGAQTVEHLRTSRLHDETRKVIVGYLPQDTENDDLKLGPLGTPIKLRRKASPVCPWTGVVGGASSSFGSSYREKNFSTDEDEMEEDVLIILEENEDDLCIEEGSGDYTDATDEGELNTEDLRADDGIEDNFDGITNERTIYERDDIKEIFYGEYEDGFEHHCGVELVPNIVETGSKKRISRIIGQTDEINSTADGFEAVALRLECTESDEVDFGLPPKDQHLDDKYPILDALYKEEATSFYKMSEVEIPFDEHPVFIGEWDAIERESNQQTLSNEQRHHIQVKDMVEEDRSRYLMSKRQEKDERQAEEQQFLFREEKGMAKEDRSRCLMSEQPVKDRRHAEEQRYSKSKQREKDRRQAEEQRFFSKEKDMVEEDRSRYSMSNQQEKDRRQSDMFMKFDASNQEANQRDRYDANLEEQTPENNHPKETSNTWCNGEKKQACTHETWKPSTTAGAEPDYFSEKNIDGHGAIHLNQMEENRSVDQYQASMHETWKPSQIAGAGPDHFSEKNTADNRPNDHVAILSNQMEENRSVDKYHPVVPTVERNSYRKKKTIPRPPPIVTRDIYQDIEETQVSPQRGGIYSGSGKVPSVYDKLYQRPVHDSCANGDVREAKWTPRELATLPPPSNESCEGKIQNVSKKGLPGFMKSTFCLSKNISSMSPRPKRSPRYFSLG